MPSRILPGKHMPAQGHQRREADYWQNALADCKCATFPAIPETVEQCLPDELVEHRFAKLQQNGAATSMSNVARAAWALVVARITNSDDVVFGAVVFGTTRDSNMTIVPVRVETAMDLTIAAYLGMIQQQEQDMTPFEQTGLSSIMQTCPGAQQACQFQSLLAVHSHESNGERLDDQRYALVLEIRPEEDQFSALARFDSRVMDHKTVERLLERFELVMTELCRGGPKMRVQDIHMAGKHDEEEIWKWNATVPEAVERCPHHIFEQRSRAHPNKLAVHAWDGVLTYGELDRLSGALAGRLMDLGVGPDDLVPLCFEKSMYTVVAMVAVLKAGAGFVLLDPALPEQRLQIIVDQIRAKIMVSSVSTYEMSSRMASEVVAISSGFFSEVEPRPCTQSHPPSPSSVMYVVYTSGSTGTPKGAAITHQNHATALYYQAERLGLTDQSRIYDFSSYSFDISIFNAFSALTLGGCLCVPSDYERQDKLAESITSYKADFIYLTPTVARQLSPQKTPTLQTIAFIGEALHPKDVGIWWDEVRVVNAYGPSECTTASTLRTSPSTPEEACSIGKGAGMVTWIVDPNNHNVLLPPGSIGELLLEGPLIGRGYLGDAKKNAAAFIKDPAWLIKGASGSKGRSGRLYKTGDLVQYLADGNLKFIGRNDNQVKIRGNRVELGEVEHALRDCVETRSVVAEIIIPRGSKSSATLAAFIEAEEEEEDDTESEVTARMLPVPAEIKDKMAQRLPIYMVPTVLFSMKRLPMTASGKIHRKQLRDIGGRFSARQMVEMHTKGRAKRQPLSEVEKQVHRIWSQVLGIDASMIGLDDSFFELGGDSLGAMEVVSEARKVGLELTVVDIFKHRSVENVAGQARRTTNGSLEALSPFSLISKDTDVASLIRDMATDYELDGASIQDAFPCTSLQEGLVSLTSKSPGDYVMQGILELAPDIDVDAFRNAWEQVATTGQILRTRILQSRHHGTLQIVVDESVSWVEATDLDSYLAEDKKKPMEIGQPLVRYALIKDDNAATGWFVWTIHHSLFDEWSLTLIIDAVTRVYQGKSITMPHFQPFIKYVEKQRDEKMANYWRQSLADCECPSFPALPPSLEQPVTDGVMEHALHHPQHDSSVTASTIIRAAWALITSRMTNSDDVVFGATLSGRGAAVPGVEAIAAPTITTVPVRIRLSREQKVADYLKAVQELATDMIPFEQMGLQHIAKLSPGARQACNFQTLLVIQPHDSSKTQEVLGKWHLSNQQQSFNTYSLILEIQLGETMVARASYDSRVIKPWLVERLLERLDFLMDQLDNAEPDQAVAEVDTVSGKDIEQLWNWNRTVPATSELCIHHVLETQAHLRPDSPALCAWDGQVTYRELNHLAAQLATHLVKRGVGPEVLVPLYFEKSMWTNVAMLGVLKAGGGFVLLDPSLPEQRLQEMIRQTKAKLLVSSRSNQSASLRLVPEVITLGSKFFAELASEPDMNGTKGHKETIGQATPFSTAYVLFTSGSTGTPKGVVITHSNVTSAVPEHVRCLGYTAASRIYDFASYSFGASLNNAFAALVAGGCLCIPSDEDRRSNLAASLTALKGTSILLTPSVAESLSPDSVPGLKTLIFGGEAVRHKDVKPWWGKAKVLTAYGSSEVTTVATVNTQASNMDEAAEIGTGAGGVTWVVDPDDHHKLLPPGCIGELLLEGPLVGSGYLGDAIKSAEVFIKTPPAWLLEGASGHQGRRGVLYKTGDLVRYNENGNLSYIGRKDAQVKIRGQRVELGEVEFRVQQCFPEAKQVAAEVVVPRGKKSSPTLAAFLVLDDAQQASSSFQTLPVDTDTMEQLAKQLPSYMVPVLFLAIKEMPMTASGKLNRRRLRELGGTVTAQQLADLGTSGQAAKRQPRTKLERQLQELWARVLNIDASAIGLDDSFYRLGGDSISAMQVSHGARAFHVHIGVVDILRQRTISNLAQATGTQGSTNGATLIDAHAPDQPVTRVDNGPAQLSPIQRLYFVLQNDPTACFDQFFYLGLRRTTSHQLVSAALETIVRRHGVLRARFRQNDHGGWEQRISDDVDASLLFRVESGVSGTAEAIAKSRAALSITEGPIFSAVLFDKPDHQTLFLTIHHLVIDLVSWRVLMQELEDIITNGPLTAPPSMDFPTWSAMQAQYAKESLHANAPDLPESQTNMAYWGMESNPNLKSGAIVEHFTMDEPTSSLILGRCNDALGTRPLELMIAALAYSFSRIFSDCALPAVFSEGHGREVWHDSLDITTTLGWFSTIFPVRVSPGANGLIDFIRETKDCIRSLSRNGWSYFTSRFADESNASRFGTDFPVEVMFNYAGFYRNLERQDGLFEQLSVPENCDPPSCRDVRRFALFDFDVQVVRGCIVGEVEFHKDIHHRDNIMRWIGEYQSTLRQMATDLPRISPGWTLSDFPNVFNTYGDIQEFRNQTLVQLGVEPLDVEDIFPCAPLQQGIILAQAKEEANYLRWCDIEIELDANQQLDRAKLTDAWKAVVKRHAMLRAVLVDDFPGSSRPMHVVLKDPELGISWGAETMYFPDFNKYGLQHRLQVCSFGERRARLRLHMNHAITDGFSQSLLCKDLQAAYHDQLEAAGSYKDFILHLENQSQEARLEFWSQYLAGVEPTLFPTSDCTIPSKVEQVAVPNLDSESIRAFCAKWDVTAATIMKLAWGLVLGMYAATPAPCFGNLYSGRDIPVEGIDSIFGPLIGMIPCCIHLNGSKGVLDTLKEVQTDYLSTIPYQHSPLAEVHRAAGLLGSRQLFNTLLSYQKNTDETRGNEGGLTVRVADSYDLTEYDVTIDVVDGTAEIEVLIDFRAGCLSTNDAARLAACFSAAVSDIVANPLKPTKDLCLLGRRDLDIIWGWNSTVPAADERFVHDLIRERSLAQPHEPAICAWDGELSYKELDDLSTRLAGHLHQVGVQPGALVPLCFEKSLYTSVAMLAVVKMGAAFVLLDPSLPEQRLQSMTQQVGSNLILSSASNRHLCARLCKTVVQVSADFIPTTTSSIPRPKTEPHSTAMFAVFTSGSTGTPKGIVLTHTNFTTALMHQAEALGFKETSRVFDFASYAFDLAVHNAFATYVTGGCLCVPSDEDRRGNPASVMKAMRATVVELTPSVSRLIDPATLPDLETIIMGGEALSVDDVNRWWGKARIVNIYGPAETHISTVNADAPSPEEATLLGKGSGLVTWIVDPENRNRLMPPGCIGELALEGPLVGQGYLNDAQKTAASFVDDPAWLLQGSPGHSGRHGRVYFSGDLVRYQDHGSLAFVARKDAQIKIRGQRVELGEVEHCVQQCLPEATRVVVDVITPQGTSTPMLSAFLQMDKAIEVESPAVEVVRIPTDTKNMLSQRLPGYMVPAVFFYMRRLPQTPSGKTDRIQLRQVGGSFSIQQLATIQTNGQGPKRQPLSEAERKMQHIWAQVLNIDMASIGLDDNFFELGGDSISVMKLVAQARKEGLVLTVAAIFRQPTLANVTHQAVAQLEKGPQDLSPFSLLGEGLDVKAFAEAAMKQHQIPTSVTILDAFPCTPLQEGLLSLSMKRSGNYVLQAKLELSSNIDISRFRNAWEEVVRSLPILRTRIIEHDSLGLLQAVTDENISWIETSGLDDYLEADRQQIMGVGQPFARYALVGESDARWFVWTVHHVLYDGWSEPLIIKAVNKAYQGSSLDLGPSFQTFIKYIQDSDTSKMVDYWRQALNDCEAVPFPPPSSSTEVQVADASVEQPLPRPRNKKFTASTVIRAAWALVADGATDSGDVCFGVTVSGRNAPVPDIERMVGPTFATLPLRVRLSKTQAIADYLETIQQQATDMIPFEQMGLHRIAKISPGSQQACNFQTLLVIQPQEEDAGENVLGEWHDGDQHQWFNTHGLTILVQISASDITVKASFNAKVISAWAVQLLLQRLAHVMQQLDNGGVKALATIDMATPQDLEKIWAWNQNVPRPADRCIHELIADRVRIHPNAPAVCAWDGELTYQRLDQLSSDLASRLADLGVGPAVFVALCFEKSMWATVAMLAMVKTGGAFVLLDASLPQQRLKSVVGQVEAAMILTSSTNETLSRQLCENVVIAQDLMTGMQDIVRPLPAPELDSVIYAVFTSGTTGTPKGAIINHRSSASAVLHQIKGFGYTTETRVYDFSTYSFDGCILNAFTVLAAGGCLCVPTDDGRKNNLADSMESLSSNAVFLTPSVAELLSPEQLPSLRSMILGGEAIRVKDIQPWWDAESVKIITIYGPSECTPVSMINPEPTSPENAVRLGWGAGQVTWIVDPEDFNSLTPLGSIGELLLEGPLVGQGYLHEPEKTADAFVVDPVWLLQGVDGRPGRHGRLYKTGDLVRYNQDGSISYIGRKDDQVKLRGQRVELGEVERHVRISMPQAKQAVAEVIVPRSDKSNPTLAVFLQIEDSMMINGVSTENPPKAAVLLPSADVLQKLAESLPTYMVPTVFFAMRKLPMGTTGKMDRKELRRIGSSFSAHELAQARTAQQGPKRQPASEAERQMQQVWAKVLGIPPASVGRDDNFFQLGGDSITAMKLVGEARKAGLELVVADMFRYPRLHEAATQAQMLGRNTKVPKMLIDGPAEQSFAQARLWFLEQLYPGLTWYLMPCIMRLKGPLRLDALTAAFIALEDRHETLRTTFSTREGTNLQHIHPVRSRELTVVDMSADQESLPHVLSQDETTPFKLENEPGWRVTLYRVGDDEHILSIVLHHIISDGWSIDILRRELSSFYSAALRGEDPLSNIDPLPIQYKDFSVWQRQQAQVDEHERQLKYWTTELETSHPAEFLCDKPRPPTLSGKADVREVCIDGPVYDKLQEFCRTHGMTPFIVLLAAFRATHYRLTGDGDGVIGSPNANRDRWELKDTIGFFVNMQCLRVKIEDESVTFDQLVKLVQSAAISSLANQDVPFERLVSKLRKERDLSRHPLIQLVFAVHSQLDLGKFALEGYEIEYIDQSITTRFDLEFHFFTEEKGLRGQLIFSTDLFHPDTIDNVLEVFRTVLEKGLNEPQTPVAALPLMTDGGYEKLDSMGLIQVKQTAYPRNSSIVDEFRQQVAACADRVAVKDASSQLTYAQLDALSEHVAQWLMSKSLAPETLVGVFCGRSCQSIIAILGILKANLAYLPFDLKIPASRMEGIISSIGHMLVLTGDGVRVPSFALEVEFVMISEALEHGARMSSIQRNTCPSPSPSSLAYVMFTSGSTGRPKGVMVEHRSVLRLIKDDDLRPHGSGIIAHMSNIAFDAATWEIYGALLNGGTVICIDLLTVLDYAATSRIFAEEKIQAIFITPALLKQYLSNCPTAIGLLDTIYVGGDRLDPQDVFTARSLMRGGKVYNGYGPTENTTFSTTYRLPVKDICVNGVAIGRALSNSGAYVMDTQQCLVPLGVVGELVVTGDGLARGYLDSQRNTGRFINVTIDGKTVRAYRTGDLARCRPSDGQIECLRRMDAQVKIRGQRVELGEIEHVLRNHESVNDAVVTLQQDPQGARLIGFITLDEPDIQQKVQRMEQEVDGDDEKKQVEVWEESFDTDIYAGFDNVKPELIGRDFVGWTSMYDGSEIDKGEMNEWLDDTIDTILNGGQAGHVLELGSGSGMILFNLCNNGMRSYVGLDPSQKAVEFVTRAAKSMPMADKIRMYKGTATDVGHLGLTTEYDLAIVNSVAQYFPSLKYLTKVVERVLQQNAKTFFFGDMRSYAMYKEFTVTRSLYRVGKKPTKDDLRRQMASMEQMEVEFQVDPAFFTALPSLLPDLVEHVEILPKKMQATNELSCYRYAAVVHGKGQGLQIRDAEGPWIDFMKDGLHHESLLKLLQSSTSPTVSVANIPYSKTIFERHVLDMLGDADGDEDWLSSARQKANDCASLCAIDLVQLARSTGYQVEISWARQRSQRGGLDAIFHRHQSNGQRVLFRFPIDDAHQSLSSQPLRQQVKQKIREQLRDGMQSQLLPYMIPQAVHILDKMPVNENGKVDRRALTESLQSRATRGPLRQPTSKTQRQLQAIWAQVLNTDANSIGLDDSFFQVGGDSLGAMRLVGDARKIGLNLAVADVFRRPVLRDMAEGLPLAKAMESIPKTEVDGPVEQSFAQRRLWFLEQLYPGLTWYMMPSAIRLRGHLELDALNTAVLALEKRHETLRTTFVSQNDIHLQEVHPFQAKKIRVVSVTEDSLMKALEDDQRTPFDLKTEPGWRVTVFRLDDTNYLLSIIMHHIVSDGWSVDILRAELEKFYSAAIRNQDPLALVESLPIQYRDFSVWQKQQDQLDEHQRQLSYWVKQLETSQPAEFLCDKPRPAALSGEAAVESLRIDGALYQQLRTFCRTQSVTPFVALLSTFRIAHFFLTGSTDATMGTVNANRDRWEVKDMIGFFVNMQCIRIRVEAESFKQLVQQVHATTIASFANQDVPFENIVSQLNRGRDLSRHPLAQLVFALHSQMDLGEFVLEGLDTEMVKVPPTTRFDLEFHFFQEQEAFQGEVLYSTDLFDAQTIRNMLSVFKRVLEAGLGDPNAAITSMSLLSDADYAKLDQMGLVEIDRVDCPDASIVDLFRQQALLNPDKVAVKDSSSQLTYAELDQQSDSTARWLAKRCLAPGTLIGVFSSRCCRTVVALLGILKANLAYLPFDVHTPRARMEKILGSVDGQTLVLVGNNVQVPEGLDVSFVPIAETLHEATSEIHITAPNATSLAYVMFTSGSTGNPKGVMINHRGIVRLVKGSNMASYLPSAPTMAHITNIAFDVSGWEIYGALLNGGMVVCISAMDVLDFRAVPEIFAREKIQAAIFTPALLKQYLIQCPPVIGALTALYVAGDRADSQDLFMAQGLMSGHVINAYGPTENSVISTLYCLQNGERCVNGVPIGKAISNSGAYVMDQQQKLVPLGVVGELVVTGDGLARGYTDPGRDIDRFVTVTIGHKRVKAYRTGDYVRYRTDGQLEFFGRIDGQIKIRGHRVELGEIEHCLRSHDSVHDAIVVLQEGQEAQLAAFVTVNETTEDAGQEEDVTDIVNVWGELFDADTYSTIQDVKPETIGRDFTGWVSTYTGQDIDKQEMNEWLDDTMATINAYEPRNVLEIGTGTGMILFNLKGVQSYVGLEPSEKAVEFTVRAAKSMSMLRDKVCVYQGTAADVKRLPTMLPNLVVINSVAQYFPSQEYLVKVIEDVVQLGGVETLFFGDIRSYALNTQFQASRALRIAGEAASKDEIRRKMEDIKRADMELMVDPAFFTALAARFKFIHHVEILPKRMKAVNELSCYRYSAVVHLQHDSQPHVHEVESEWIDFQKNNLNRQSLLELLGQTSSTLAVSNIPFQNTIVERHVVEALDRGQGPDWITSALRNAEHCPSMSVAGLVELANLACFQVEISCARQYSQRGGLDAVFHRHQPSRGDRVLFRFPTDHNRPSHLLTSRPLRLQLYQTVQEGLFKRLQTQLPSYMVPHAITVVDELPINENGKVDRRALAARTQTRTAARASIRQPTTDMEREMQRIWSHVLHISLDSIGLDDSFFHLGGNSITAMRIVSEARKVGFKLSVADIFRHDVLEDLACHLSPEEEETDIVFVDRPPPVSVLEEIAALGVSVDDVEDVLPLTSFQEKIVLDGETVGQHANYFYIDLEDLDVSKIQTSYWATLDKFSILRARFLHLEGKLWQVVVRQLRLPIHIEDVDDVNQAADQFCVKDLHEMSSTDIPISITLLRHKDGVRLILRLSHAHGIERPAGPTFGRFLSYAAQQRTKAITYWTKVLTGSSLTVPEPILRPKAISGSPQRVYEEAEIDLPQLPSKTTPATLLSAAWALLLSHITGEDDVVFGHVVAGRNAAMSGIDEVVGTCLNIVPIRVNLPAAHTPRQLLLSVQEQFFFGEADLLGFKDIIEHCTDWPVGTTFESMIQHQNIDEHPEIESAGAASQVQFFENSHLVPPSLFIVSYPRGRHLDVKLFGNTHILTKEMAKGLIDRLCKITEELGNLDCSLQVLRDRHGRLSEE
ncbi:Nonribosomal Peptide Synthetase [Metarhizium humberi]|uniref:Nonribosomal Peptide Synthetase n=1 Tax=Metarhizium humberi TaxID=2596975 RepID=A0A9P8S3N6_9HYPO|nr:Nonribosomal Peptide Synthetase [Metarhizium humberi]